MYYKIFFKEKLITERAFCHSLIDTSHLIESKYLIKHY